MLSIPDQTDSILFQSVSSLFNKFEKFILKNKIYVLQKENLINYQLTLWGVEKIVQKVPTLLNLGKKVEAPFAVVALRNAYIAHGTDKINFLSGINWFLSFWLATGWGGSVR